MNSLGKSLICNFYRRGNCRCYCQASFNASSSYEQGRTSKDGKREYFYYVDHQGQLFLEGTKIKNFVTCFKDKNFLAFFFKRLRLNKTDDYADEFPYISRCGPEINFVRCENKPIVYTDIVPNARDDRNGDRITMNGIGEKMTFPFDPTKLCMLPRNGRVYHPAPKKVGGAGILKTSLAIEFSSLFSFDKENPSDTEPPTQFEWKGVVYNLDNSLWDVLKMENVEEP